MKKQITYGILILSLVISLAFGSKIVETVEKGTYQIKQAAVTGKMSAHMTPGMYGQFFGDIQVWPVSDTFTFTTSNHPMPIRFNDGSQSRAEGSVRVFMPRDGEQAIELITRLGFKSPEAIQEQLVYPHLGRVLRLTSNLMSAKESFNEKRADFDAMAFDQLLYGVYKTQTKVKKEEDLVTGKKRTKEYKVILRDKEGNAQREKNPIAGTGITFGAFRITSIKYSDAVKKQIEEQRKAVMEVETAIANSKRAEQDAKTIKMQGIAKVTEAQYEKEQEKIRAVVDAQKEKEVAELMAQKNLEVAKLEKLAAAETKQQLILLGDGEAYRKNKVFEADGALAQKLETYENVSEMYAGAMENYQGNWVPHIQMGANQSGDGNQGNTLIELLTTKTALDLGLDPRIAKGKSSSNNISK